jgi:bifunctional NMN adenylyltransferase/nudix hydrolase
MSVFIGRFQPPHKAHIEIIKQALSKTEKCLVLIGSSFQAADIRNPWTQHDRVAMIDACFDMDERKRIVYDHISDNPYNELAWIKDVQRAVETAYYNNFGWQDKQEIFLIGHHKDASSYYLDVFPFYKQIEVENIYGLDATTIRDLYFAGRSEWKNVNRKKVAQFIPQQVMLWLSDYMDTAAYDKIVHEYEFHRLYKLQWSQSPYPPTFVTADAVVTCLGHVLLVRRKSAPGKGLAAMPGGFVGQFETVKEAALRELEEETKIKVPPRILATSIVKEKRYDHPKRSTRGRTITTAFHIDLTGEKSLPKVKGSDDAETAKWVPLHQFIQMQEKMFEDHYYIITDLLGLG